MTVADSRVVRLGREAANIVRRAMTRPRAALLALALVCGVFAAVATAGQDATPPPGATALCNDGTYSFSQTRSGTCSHHFGVKEWLTPTTSTTTTTATTTTTTTTTSTTSTTPTPTVAPPTTPVPTPAWNGSVGVTVLLTPRTKMSGCKLGPNPDRRCSPGAYYSKLTKAVLCSSSFHTSDVRNVPESEKFAVETEYGMTPGHYGSALEIDHLVSLELGGSNDIANLFPEKAAPRPGYRVKDKLENKLHSLVCSGAMTLAAAQRGIATNWQALYTKVFGVTP